MTAAQSGWVQRANLLAQTTIAIPQETVIQLLFRVLIRRKLILAVDRLQLVLPLRLLIGQRFSTCLQKCQIDTESLLIRRAQYRKRRQHGTAIDLYQLQRDR
ncbi:hypothetical protein D3C76_1393770 [compost metagenome]